MDENIQAFLKVLDPTDNSTGGGTASAADRLRDSPETAALLLRQAATEKEQLKSKKMFP